MNFFLFIISFLYKSTILDQSCLISSPLDSYDVTFIKSLLCIHLSLAIERNFYISHISSSFRSRHYPSRFLSRVMRENNRKRESILFASAAWVIKLVLYGFHNMIVVLRELLQTRWSRRERGGDIRWHLIFRLRWYFWNFSEGEGGGCVTRHRACGSSLNRNLPKHRKVEEIGWNLKNKAQPSVHLINIIRRHIRNENFSEIQSMTDWRCCHIGLELLTGNA